MEAWSKGRGILRCHNSRFGATELNPGFGHGRFHPFQDSEGRVVPTLYGASNVDGALSESIFHNVPVRGSEKAVRRSSLRPMLVSTVAARRDLALIQLHGHGLVRLGVSRSELIDSEVRHYARTAAWAAALHERQKDADGLVWVSRKFDTAFGLVLFGDRVDRSDLEVIEPPLPLFLGEGYDEIQRVAGLAGITILG
ncbi:MAG TPA: RES family NAD+ phosphorylase [Thermoanaerobaculia bacterium]|nr:RES family NAD+ phosphorylase [Thermoanaerobaculia bacterium]